MESRYNVLKTAFESTKCIFIGNSYPAKTVFRWLSGEYHTAVAELKRKSFVGPKSVGAMRFQLFVSYY